MAGNFFRGTTAEQDGRWSKSGDKKLIEKMSKEGKFALVLEQKVLLIPDHCDNKLVLFITFKLFSPPSTQVDLGKINQDVMSKWVSEKIIQILGFEDEIVINLVINMLESKVTPSYVHKP